MGPPSIPFSKETATPITSKKKSQPGGSDLALSPPPINQIKGSENLTSTEKTRAAMATSAPVSLRRFDLSDLDDCWVWASDQLVAANFTWEAYTSKDDLRRHMEEIFLPSPWFRAIVVGGRPVGAVLMTSSEGTGNQRRREIGYMLARDWWGKGVATSAVRAAMEAAMSEIEGLERVEALVEETNRASQRVLEKVGFRREGLLRRYWWNKGVLRDMIMYSFVRGDAFLI